ncbi:MAG: MarR family transcriptional regulator [Phycisphaerales bacterium]|nr:MarR family transcriptional regulator [Phycisphaerales bacterium]
MGADLTLEDEIVISLRRIIRGVDLHSRALIQSVGLTWPQLAVLRTARRVGPSSVTALARAVRLSQGAVTGILQRLERMGFIERQRSADDRRAFEIRVTPEGHAIIERSPSLLQDRFLAELGKLRDWERHQTLAALQRVAEMMDVESLEASPYLVAGPLDVAPSEDALSRPM